MIRGRPSLFIMLVEPCPLRMKKAYGSPFLSCVLLKTPIYCVPLYLLMCTLFISCSFVFVVSLVVFPLLGDKQGNELGVW